MRPQKSRMIDAMPRWRLFRPDEREGNREMELPLDLFEAFRLVDGEGLSQEEAAQRMGISTPTLCRLVGEARKRVAQALTFGCTIRIEGGNVTFRRSTHDTGHGGHGLGYPHMHRGGRGSGSGM